MDNIIGPLLTRGYQGRRENRREAARAAFAEAAALSREHNDPRLLAQAITGLGVIARDLGDTQAALRYYQEAVERCRTIDDPLLLAHTVRHVGDILRKEGRPLEGLPCYEEALGIYLLHKETPPLDLANALRGLALLKAETGDNEAAVALWRQAGELYATTGIEAGVAESGAQISRLRALLA